MAFKTRWLRELKNINCLFLYVVKKIYIFFHYDNYNTKNSQTFSLIKKCKMQIIFMTLAILLCFMGGFLLGPENVND